MSDTTNALTTEIAVIEQSIGTPAYWRDDGRQQRYRDLLDARDNGAPAPAPVNDALREIARIEEMMRKEPRRYFKDEALQAKYRQLVAQRDGLPDETSPANDTALDTWRSVVPSDLQAEWSEGGNFEASTRRLQTAVLTIAAGLEEEWPIRSFLDSFDQLPATVRTAALREAGSPASSFTKVATDQEMATWRQLYGGPEMIAAWGSRARHHVGVALDRLGRIHDRLSASDRSAWLHWQGHVIAPRALECLLYSMGSTG